MGHCNIGRIWATSAVLGRCCCIFHLSMCEVAVFHPPLRMAHLTNRHMVTSQTLAIFAFGDVLHMCMCRRIREGHLDHIWRSVCSLGIQQGTRGGNSTIQLPRRPSSVNEQSLSPNLLAISDNLM